MDLFDRLKAAFDVLKAADLIEYRCGYGVVLNESRARADAKTWAEREGATGTSDPEASKGQWMAYVSRETAYHDSPAEAVRLVEEQCAELAFKYLSENRDRWAQKASDAAKALTTIQNMKAAR